MPAISSEYSWIKHELIAKVVGAQVAAARLTLPRGSLVLIDGNAGDGNGVAQRQSDLFGANDSRPTPILLQQLAAKYDADLIVCESHRKRRYELMQALKAAAKSPITITVLSDHADAADFVTQRACHDYALWVSDPCGYSKHGVEAMRKIANAVVRSDFIIILNEGSLNRLIGVRPGDVYWSVHQKKYLPLCEPLWWLDQLSKRYLARTPVIHQSNNFNFRLLVISNYLTDGVRRVHHRIEIIQRELK